MDKETLSHYGWIVILVLILAVMLALASPFGSFIAGAIKSTTAGLFDVNQNALGSAGINVGDLVFENCDHLETEVRNMSDTYTGDICCKACGAVLQAGQTVRPKVPDGGKYTAADGTVYNPGDEMPEVVTTGDIYTYGDYEYRYNQYTDGKLSWTSNESQDGWGVDTINNEKSVYGDILESINGKNITNMESTFHMCYSLTKAPQIPQYATNMTRTFRACNKLTTAPIIPNNVTILYATFDGCKALVSYEGSQNADGDFSGWVIPDSVTNMYLTFQSCEKMTRPPVISKEVQTMYGTFWLTGITVAPNLTQCTKLTDMQSTFNYCRSLTKAPIIPNSVTNMRGTFMNCSTLTDVSDLAIPSGVTDMTFTFSGCSSLTDVSHIVIPNGITELWGTFANCGLIDEGLPVIPNNITSLMRTFMGCTLLTKLTGFTLPNSVTSMEETFWNCTGLTDLSQFVIPSNVSDMEGIFAGCTSLTTVPVIPSSAKYMAEAFKDCTSLTGTITFTCLPSNWTRIFDGVDFETQNLTFVGTFADAFGATGTNYCTECNGKCNGGH